MSYRSSFANKHAISSGPFPVDASVAEKIAHSVEKEVSDWSFRRPILNRLPDRFSIPIATRYTEIYHQDGRRLANLFMLDVKDGLTNFSLRLSANYDDLVNHAKLVAERCSFIRSRFNSNVLALNELTKYIRKCYKIDLSKIFKINHAKSSVTVTVTDGSVTDTDTVTEKNRSRSNLTFTVDSVLNRLCDELWWRRTLNAITLRNVEKYSIDMGLVHIKAGIYISDESMHRRSQQIKRNKKKLEQISLVNELGQEFTLQELAEKSLANPTNRRSELMVRIRGTEEVSKLLGHAGMFYTITCPSRMHARLSKSGDQNPKYDGTTPREAQGYIAELWTRIRSKLSRQNIRIYGFRVVEPHHDGTPHWHLLLFTETENVKKLTQIMSEYALQADSDEYGAKKHRFTAIKIDPKKGSATGYISKYISKSIDGFGLDDDLYGKDAATSAQRITGWKSVWGIRQFQQIGGPPVTLYRELRRINGNDLYGEIFKAWEAAEKADWGKLIQLLGGPTVKRKEITLKISRSWSDQPNKYREPKGYKIIGLEHQNIVIPTRIHTWTVKQSRYQSNVQFLFNNKIIEFCGLPLPPIDASSRNFENINRFAS